MEVNVSISQDMLLATVSDSGPGFDPTHISPNRADGGLGLTGLGDRAESLGGSFSVKSKAGRGTILELLLPIQKKEFS